MPLRRDLTQHDILVRYRDKISADTVRMLTTDRYYRLARPRGKHNVHDVLSTWACVGAMVLLFSIFPAAWFRVWWPVIAAAVFCAVCVIVPRLVWRKKVWVCDHGRVGRNLHSRYGLDYGSAGFVQSGADKVTGMNCPPHQVDKQQLGQHVDRGIDKEIRNAADTDPMSTIPVTAGIVKPHKLTETLVCIYDSRH